MKNNVIKFTVNPLFASLENIMKQVQQVAEGKIIDGIFVERKSIFKSEVEVLVSTPQTIYIDKPIYIEKEVAPLKITVEQPSNKRPPTIKYKQNASSKYRGVTKNRNRFEVAIMHNRNRHFIGSFGSELEAARAYNKAAIELKGDKAILNIIDIDQEEIV